MTDHDTIREWLPLAAAGVLDAGEQRLVDEHASGCEACRRELEQWVAYARGLGQMRPPAVPARLMERTRARVLQERAAAEGNRTESLILSGLAAFTWLVGLTTWFLLRVFTGGALVLFGVNMTGLLAWSVASTAFVWLTAATAGLMVGRRRREMRRVL
jgi:predicted anti-sigma-YlaC factor YlaD